MAKILYVPSGEIELPDDPALAELAARVAAMETALAGIQEQLNTLAFTQVESAVATSALVSQVTSDLADQLEEVRSDILELAESEEEESEESDEPDIISESESSGEESGISAPESSGDAEEGESEEEANSDAVLIRIERSEPERERTQHTRFRRGR
jgi:hypothetical protein